MTTDSGPRTQTAGATDMQAADNAPPDRAQCELHFTRVFNAPRPIVFRAWTDPKQAAHRAIILSVSKKNSSASHQE